MSYKVSGDLKLGGRLGASTEIKDNVNVFPFLVVDW